MTRRFIRSTLLAATGLVMSCAANPNAPSPVKGDPPAAFERRAPDATLAHDLEPWRQAGAIDAPA